MNPDDFSGEHLMRIFRASDSHVRSRVKGHYPSPADEEPDPLLEAKPPGTSENPEVSTPKEAQDNEPSPKL